MNDKPVVSGDLWRGVRYACLIEGVAALVIWQIVRLIF